MYNAKQKCPDAVMKNYCLSKENCLRKILIHGVGGEDVSTSEHCCSNCSGGHIPYPQVDVLVPGKSSRAKRPPTVRVVSEQLQESLREHLVQARNSILLANPGYRMLGHNFVCPDSVIDDICCSAKSICSVNDMKMYFLRPELREQFFTIVMSCMSDAPVAKRRRK